MQTIRPSHDLFQCLVLSRGQLPSSQRWLTIIRLVLYDKFLICHHSLHWAGCSLICSSKAGILPYPDQTCMKQCRTVWPLYGIVLTDERRVSAEDNCRSHECDSCIARLLHIASQWRYCHVLPFNGEALEKRSGEDCRRRRQWYLYITSVYPHPLTVSIVPRHWQNCPVLPLNRTVLGWKQRGMLSSSSASPKGGGGAMPVHI